MQNHFLTISDLRNVLLAATLVGWLERSQPRTPRVRVRFRVNYY